jgi:hypothetical protein
MFAMVNVLPLPVTPNNVWRDIPSWTALDKRATAAGWSPVILKSDTNWKSGISGTQRASLVYDGDLTPGI